VPTESQTRPTAAQVVSQALAEAATAAGYAPSIYNTQPWRWRLAGNHMDLYVERSRVLEVRVATAVDDQAGRPGVGHVGAADPASVLARARYLAKARATTA
jgi:hypothetical protein